jgi:putative hemolysin
VLRVIGDEEHSRYPVCRGGLDDVLGVISAQTLLQRVMNNEPLARPEGLQRRCSCRRRFPAWSLLEHFRASSAQIVFVVDEYGEVQGMITCATC